MINRKFLSLLTSCFLIFGSSMSFADASDTTVFITGSSGIAARLHKPVLKEFPGINIESVRIPEKPFLSEKACKPTDQWLFLGTPVYKHKEHIISSCKKYKRILCEKPVGLSKDEINEIKTAISQNETCFIVNYALRFLPCLNEIKEFTKNNEIKSVTIICNANFNKFPPNKAWKSDYKSGGGILYSILPHMVDLLNFLNFEESLSDITFESISKIPMDDISLYSKTKSGIKTAIHIDLLKDFDEFTLKLETPKGGKIFNLINSKENKITGTKYLSGTLSATSKISPWRISFKNLLEALFADPENPNFAKVEDAEKVHDVLGAILSKENQIYKQ